MNSFNFESDFTPDFRFDFGVVEGFSKSTESFRLRFGTGSSFEIEGFFTAGGGPILSEEVRIPNRDDSFGTDFLEAISTC